MQFFQKLKSSFDHVLIYEDRMLQDKARSCMPLSEMRSKAKDKLEEMKVNNKEAAAQMEVQEMLLLELLAWFKKDFFKWTDAPPCDGCGSATRNAGMVSPNAAESMWGAGRVENYQCGSCSISTRFPRYNHPGKLLETRQGRCGEWANCFTLCCRAVGFEARYVLDWTDHVWTEVYSEAQKRWLHCDPCENTCDKPLLYEAGWGKKLTYVIAFSKDDIQDVTWRYSAKQEQVRSRRTECTESWLVSTIMKLRNQRQKDLSAERKQMMLDRLAVELVEFMNIKTAGEGETEGRTTGSMAWRLARGEMGAPPSKPQPTIIKLTPQEINSKLLHIKYW